MSFASEFKEFAVKGNVIDLAVGVIIGAAFGKIVDSLVNDLIMPVIGRIVGGLDFSNYFIPLAPPPTATHGPMATRRSPRPAFRVRVRQLHHRAAELRDPRLHHLPHGQADQPAAPERAAGARRRRPRTSSCCARSATRCGAEVVAARHAAMPPPSVKQCRQLAAGFGPY